MVRLQPYWDGHAASGLERRIAQLVKKVQRNVYGFEEECRRHEL